MPFIKEQAYTDEQKRAMRLEACRRCIFVACNGSNMNACSIEQSVCTIDNNKSIVAKSNNIDETCPKDYWSASNKTLDSYVPGPGCGCKK